MCLVDPSSGRLTLTEIDFTLRGALPLVLERSYRSTNVWHSDLGQGWGHTFGVELRRDETGIMFRMTDGRRVPLTLPAVGGTSVNAFERVALSHVRQRDIPWPALATLPSGLLAVSAEGPTFLFDARPVPTFLLRGLADRSGNLVLVANGALGLPERLEDPHGRILEFARDPRGMLRRVTLRARDADAPVVLVEYAQDASGNLIGVRDAAGVRRYAYDEGHKLVAHVDRLGKSCRSTYDELGRCTLTEGPGGVKRRTYQYDPDAKRTTITDSLGHTTVIEYDARERVLRTIDRAGGISTFTYDGDGRLIQAADQLGHTSSVLSDSAGAPAGKVRPDGTSVAIVANDAGEVAKIITSLGAVTSYERDPLGRVVAISTSGRERTEVGYDEQGNIARLKTPFGKEVRLTWSPDRRRLVETDTDGMLTDQRMDGFGRVVLVRNALGASTQYEYDVTGGIARITHPDGTVRNFTRDAEGRVTSRTDESGMTTRWTYDGAGRSIEMTLPDGGIVRSDYDLENRLVAVTDPGGLRHEFRYTAEGLVAGVRFPDERVLVFRHDAVGRIVGLLHPDGSATEARRDERGRIEAVAYPDGTVKTARHDTESHWISVELAGHAIGREVTPEGKAVDEHQDDFRLIREFGDAGQLLSVTDSAGRRVRYGYNEDGRVVQVEITEGSWTDDAWGPAAEPRTHRFEHDRVGNLTRWMTPWGITETRAHDVRGRLVEQTVTSGEHEILRRKYAYNETGRVITIDDSRRGRWRFDLDAMARVRTAVVDGARQQFTWGPSGERTGDLLYGTPFRVNQAGDRRYGYDGKGNVVRRGTAAGTQELTWTPHGLLAEARLPDQRTVRFSYDPHDRLIARSVGAEVRRYFWNDDSLLRISGGGLSTLAFVFVPGSLTPIEQSIDGRVFSIHVDHLGTVRELIDERGEVSWQSPTDVWGERTDGNDGPAAAIDCPLGFPGQIRDEITGLHYNRYRFYDPQIGRYLTPDPVGVFGGLDAYRYVSDPVNLQDPTGLACRGKTDDPTLYRGDSRPPDQICGDQGGFAPSNPTANIDLVTHVNGVPTTGSNWVSTSYDASTAERFAHSSANQYGGQPLVYVIANPGCGEEVDCDPGVKAWEQQYGPATSEQEIAFNGGLHGSHVVGYYNAGDPSSFQPC